MIHEWYFRRLHTKVHAWAPFALIISILTAKSTSTALDISQSTIKQNRKKKTLPPSPPKEAAVVAKAISDVT